jgi:hypothetical protein
MIVHLYDLTFPQVLRCGVCRVAGWGIEKAGVIKIRLKFDKIHYNIKTIVQRKDAFWA